MRITLRLLMCAFIAGTAHAQSSAQSFPAKPVRMIVPYAPGGIADNLARLLGQRLTAAWGQPLIVENRPGAGTNLGSELVAKAAPDGYTLLSAGIAQTVGPALYAKLPYDPIRDFAWVTNMAKVPVLLVVHPSLPARNAREIIALAKAKPGMLAYASAGIATSGHLAGELFKSVAHVDLTHIPYKGSAPALIDNLSGQVALYFGAISSPLPHVKSGRLRAIAVTTLTRASAAPDIPTLDEQGLKGFDTATWYGVAAPAATPAAIVAKLNADIVRIIKLPEVRDRLASEGADVVGDSPEALTAFVKAEIAKWSKVVKQSGVKAE
ncbi:MAG TPA: tripartite tricarboxylate transporter substrate binding protein [Burkholderiales bacterium]|nr:tripartite tricarboxylate transporter substrate binding protein [Burkholderiales bacterium]